MSECAFGYRDSVFKHEKGKKYIVTRVAFRLSTHPQPKIEYKDLRHYFEGKKEITVGEVRDAVNHIRAQKFPNMTKIGTAGSFFKNPVVPKALHKEMESWLDAPIPFYEVDEAQVKIPLAWILERLGWKGKKLGTMGCWETQPLVLVHYGGGTASEMILFARWIMKEVQEKTTIKIIPEVHIVTNE